MSLKEHLPGNLDILSADRALRKLKTALGKAAIFYGENLGAPQGRHSRTHETGPRPDIGEVARNAGFNTIADVPSLPAQDDVYKEAAPDLIKRLNRPAAPEQPAPNTMQDDNTIPLFTQPQHRAPKGPDYPYKFRD